MNKWARQHGGLILHILVAVFTFFGLAIVCDEYFVASLDRLCEGESSAKQKVAIDTLAYKIEYQLFGCVFRKAINFAFEEASWLVFYLAMTTRYDQPLQALISSCM